MAAGPPWGFRGFLGDPDTAESRSRAGPRTVLRWRVRQRTLDGGSCASAQSWITGSWRSAVSCGCCEPLSGVFDSGRVDPAA